MPHFAILNLKSTILLDVYKHYREKLEEENKGEDSNSPLFSIALRPRALLIVKDEVYTKYMHGIAERKEDEIDEKVINAKEAQLERGQVLQRELRVSLTIRHVKKVIKSKVLSSLFK